MQALEDHILKNIERMRQIFANDSMSRLPKDEKARQFRYAFRILNIPDYLSNARLVLENHELDNDIAQRQGKSKPITQGRIAIDRFMISQAEAAHELTDRFAEIWGYTIDPDTMRVSVIGGDKLLQARFGKAESDFNNAYALCSNGTTQPSQKSVEPKTLAEAQSRCAAFQSIYAAVMRD